MPMITPFRILFALALLLLVAGLNAQTRDELQKLIPVEDKPPAPDFTLVDVDGVTHNLSDYRGKPVIVNFWATWCAPCRKEMPSMERAWEKLQAQEVAMLAVNWGDSAKAIDEFLESLPVTLTFPVLIGGDREMTTEWGVKGLPTSFVIDPEGRIVYRVAGELEWDEQTLLDKVFALKEE